MKKLIKRTLSAVISLSIALSSFTLIPASAQGAEAGGIDYVYITTNGGNVNSELVANFEYDGNWDDLTYQWYFTTTTSIRRDSDAKAIDGATGKTLNLAGDSAAYKGKYLYCLVTEPNGNAVMSDSFGQIIEAGSGVTPVVDRTSMHIYAKTGQIGDTLYAHYTYQNPSGTPEGDSIIEWQQSKVAYNTGWEPLATGPSYTLKPEDYGTFIRYKVKVADRDGDSAGELIGPKYDSDIYFTPENLLVGAVGKTIENGYPFTLESSLRTISDGGISASSTIYYGNSTSGKESRYVVDAGSEIAFDKLMVNGNYVGKLRTAEVSVNGSDYEAIPLPPTVSADNDKSAVYLLDQIYHARYIKLTFEKQSSNYQLMEVQASLQPESFSELLAVNGATYDRAAGTITSIPEGTTVETLKGQLVGVPDKAIEASVLDYDGVKLAETDEIKSGYKLQVVSENKKTTAEYLLSNTAEIPAVIVASVTAAPKDTELGLRTGSTAQVTYSLQNLLTGEPDTTTPVSIQWYFGSSADGEFQPIAGAESEEYVITDDQVGGYLKAEVTPDNSAPKMSAAIGPINKGVSQTPTAPVAQNVTAKGTSKIVCPGDVLTGAYEYFDENGAEEDTAKTEKQWYRVSGGAYTAIAGASGTQYTLTDEDVNCDIAYGVKPWSKTNPDLAADILEGVFAYSEPVHVLENPVLLDKNALELGIIGKVTSNLELPAKGANGSAITWKSDNPSVISDKGVVARGASDVVVTLTATLTHPDRAESETKSFTLTVKKADANPRPPVDRVQIKQLSNGDLEVEYSLNGIGENDLSYQWYWLDGVTAVERDSKVKVINGATKKTFTPTAAEKGKMVVCNVIPKGDKSKAAASDTFGRLIAVTGSGDPVVDGEAASIWSESTKIGDTLHAVYSYQSPAGKPEGDSEIKWFRSANYTTGLAAFQEIPGAVGPSYTLTPDDYGKFITYSVTPKDQDGRTGATVSPQNASGANVIYCTPENLLMDAKAIYDKAGGAYAHALMSSHRGVRDFRIDQNVNMYYAGADGGTDGWYIVDAGKEILFDRLIYVGDTASIAGIKAEVSTDGTNYTEVCPAHTMKDTIDEMLLDTPVTARYIKFTFTRIPNKWHAAREVQAFLQKESFSELFAVNLNGASYDRDEKSVTNIPAGTTVEALKASAAGPGEGTTVEVVDYSGAVLSDNEEVISGYKLRVTSANGKTTTEYTLSNTDVLPNVVVKTLAAVPAYEKLGVRVGQNISAVYSLESANGTVDDTKTAFQWYYSPTENGAYTEIAGAVSRTYNVAADCLNGYLKVKVTPADGVARTSTAVGPVRQEVSANPEAPVAENVKISTAAEVVYAGDTLKGSYEYFDANADDEDQTKTKLQWYREKDGKRTAISGAVTDTYQTTVDDEDCKLIYSVQPYTSAAEPYAGSIAYSEPVSVTMEPARADYNALTISGASGKVKSNLLLPIKGKAGSVITWESSDSKVISTAGVVKCQSSEEDVTLTATIKHPDRELTMEKVFEVTVAADSGRTGSSSGSGGGSGSNKNTSVYLPSQVQTPPVYTDDPQKPGETGNKFGLIDVSENDWAYPHIMNLMEKGVLSKPADGRFNPKDSLTREQGVKMLIETFKLNDENAVCDFTDISKTDWSYPYIAVAFTKGLINGMGDGTFGKGANVTRQDFAVMAYNFLKASGIEKAAVNEGVAFTDEAAISDYAKEAVAYLTKAGIINGTPEGQFLPGNGITREEAAKIVNGLL